MSNAPPQLIADRYRLVTPLGQGGMGRVWKARDEVLHRDVAIKELVPPPGLTEDERREMRERSLREARAIARLNHANVVRVFDVLRTDGDPWIVMEYVPSRSLQDVLASDGPVSPTRAAEIGLGVLGALKAAHRAGVMHRDVKPGNVLLGDEGRVVLTDFGLATVPGDPNVTRTGLVLGSPAYIAPERAKDGTAGPEGDLWSLGATLYAAVEGQSPYARSSAIATLAALATEPPPQAKRAGSLKAVLNGLLRKDPTNRINAEVAERLLRRAAGRRTRPGMSLLDGVRRPSPLGGTREPRAKFAALPAPRAPQEQSAATPTPTPTPAPTPIVPPSAAETAKLAPPASAAETAKITPAVDQGARVEQSPVVEAAPVAVPEVAAATSGEAQGSAKSGSASTPERAVASAPIPVAPAAAVAGRDKFVIGRMLDTVPRERRGWLVGGLVGLLLVALVVIVPLVNREPANDSTAGQTAGKPTGSAGPAPTPSVVATTASPTAAPTSEAAPEPTPTPTPAPTPTPGGHPAPGIPEGWYLYKDSTGFSLPLPVGMVETGRGDGHIFFQQGNRKLIIGQTDTPKPDPEADWRAQEPNRRNYVNNYKLISIVKVDYWLKAADWEWTQTDERGAVHVRNRGFITAKDKAYAIRWEVPTKDWASELANFEILAAGFRPVRG